MKRDIKISGQRRAKIDDDKLAMAFWMLAKTLHERRAAEAAAADMTLPQAPEMSE